MSHDVLVVGSFQLSCTGTGGIVVYRGDNRSPQDIAAAGGFYSWERYKGDAQIKREFADAFTTQGPRTHATEHVRSPKKSYVSMGMDEDSGGYGDQSAYLYRVEIPGLQERQMTAQTLNLGRPFTYVPKNSLDPRLLMDGATVADSTFVAMIPPRTVELTFITPIPRQYIVAFRRRGNANWERFC